MSITSRIARAVGTAALVATMALPATAALAADPQSDNPSQAVQVQSDQSLKGSLGAAPAGGWAGSADRFAYYRFHYDGNNKVVTINMQVWPDDETILSSDRNGVGFVVYGPKTAENPTFSYVVSGTQPKKMPNVSGNLISPDAGDYLIQVYNDSQVPIDYSLWVDGLPVQPAPAAEAPAAPAPAAAPVTVGGPAVAVPAVVAPPAAAPAAPAAPSTESGVKAANNFSGELVPGKSDTFEFDYPGDESVYTINVQIAPDAAYVLQNAGFEVYTPMGDLQVKGGAQPKLQPNVSANVISRIAGTYYVKVFNDSQTPLSYTVTLVTNPPAPK